MFHSCAMISTESGSSNRDSLGGSLFGEAVLSCQCGQATTYFMTKLILEYLYLALRRFVVTTAPSDGYFYAGGL